jgi:hypothetical protein
LVRLFSAVRAAFDVQKTASDPNRYTVVLPKPVTKEVADKFNAVFKPK